jgi:protoheme IX farnesyltransferase
MTEAVSGDIASAAGRKRGMADLVHVYNELAKARLSSLVVFTTAAGFIAGSSARIDWLLMVATVLGAALAAGSANSLNQVLEATRDGRMERTKDRPLPSGRIGLLHATTVGIVIGIVGVGMLAAFVNMLTAALAAFTILLYLFVYTPMKVRTPLNTLVGAICGAIPPVMGWTAATGSFGPGGWILGGVLFVWQIPHFLALAWRYREDYARGGYRMLPVVDPEARRLGWISFLYCVALAPISVSLTVVGLAGWVYGAGALLLGLWFGWLAYRLLRRRDDASARRVFLASIIYLPLLLVLAMADREPVGAVEQRPVDAYRTAAINPGATATLETP